MTAARVLVPLSIGAGMVAAGSVAEPDTAVGEVAWVASTAYVVDDRRTFGGSVWSCVKDHTGIATEPPDDQVNWLRRGPSNRMAPFDDYTTTAAAGTTSITYVLRPGFCNGLRLDGLVGTALTITIKDSPAGVVVWTWTCDLWEQAIGLYELLFQPLRQLRAASFDGLPMSPDPEITITITSPPGGAVAVGSIMAGDWRPLIGDSKFGGVGYGANSARKSYTYWDEKDDGTYDIVRRPSRRDIQAQVVMAADKAMYADALLEEIMDRLVAFEASGLARYGYLNTTGFVSGSITADTYSTTRLDLTIKGSI